MQFDNLHANDKPASSRISDAMAAGSVAKSGAVKGCRQRFQREMAGIAVGAVVLAFAGCSAIPGMDFQNHTPISEDDPNSYPTVIPITQGLIAEQITQQEAVDAAMKKAVMKNLVGKPRPYRIGAADVLSVIVWEHPELVLPNVTYNIGATSGTTTIPYVGSSPSVGYDVSQDGYIQFPYLGLVRVEGLTENQIQKTLSQKLVSYLTKPQLTVRVIGYNSQHVYVDGAVTNSGALPVTSIPMTLGLALNSAGGITTVGDRSRVFLTRTGQTYRINLTELTRVGINPAQIPLYDGDTIHVEPLDSNKIVLAGEMLRPTTVAMRTNGRMTLSEALGEGGSVSTSSSAPQSIYVLRAATDGKSPPQIFRLNSKSAAGLTLAQQFPLDGKDVVYVDATGLVRFSRLVSLLTGGIGAISTAQVISQR